MKEMMEKIQLLLNHPGPGSDTHPFHSHSVSENPSPQCRQHWDEKCHPRPGRPLQLCCRRGCTNQRTVNLLCHLSFEAKNAESQRDGLAQAEKFIHGGAET